MVTRSISLPYCDDCDKSLYEWYESFTLTLRIYYKELRQKSLPEPVRDTREVVLGLCIVLCDMLCDISVAYHIRHRNTCDHGIRGFVSSVGVNVSSAHAGSSYPMGPAQGPLAPGGLERLTCNIFCGIIKKQNGANSNGGIEYRINSEFST